MKWAHSSESKDVVQGVGGYETLLKITTRFYAKTFEDAHLHLFVTDQSEDHPGRLAKWLFEKLDGEPVWTDSRPPDSRSRSHRKAWESPHRESNKVGRRFKLDDSRVWMRLFFWSVREELQYVKNATSEEELAAKAFWRVIVRFISHFVGVYEYSAPPFAVVDACWSAEEENLSQYRDNARIMHDVIGISHASYADYPPSEEQTMEHLR